MTPTTCRCCAATAMLASRISCCNAHHLHPVLTYPSPSPLDAMTDWITDRPPTAADADGHGEVLAKMPSGFKPGESWSAFTEWEQVPAGTPWRHTSMWPPAEPTTTIPRLFTSITHTGAFYLALADDGTAWFDLGDGWEQLAPLPAREVEG